MMFAFVRELSSKLNIEAKEGGRHRGKGMLKRNPESKGGGMGKEACRAPALFPDRRDKNQTGKQTRNRIIL